MPVAIYSIAVHHNSQLITNDEEEELCWSLNVQTPLLFKRALFLRWSSNWAMAHVMAPDLEPWDQIPAQAPWEDNHLESEPKPHPASEQFRVLLDQLLQQHLQELSRAKLGAFVSASRSVSGDVGHVGTLGRDRRNLVRGTSTVSNSNGPNVAVRKTTILNALGAGRRSKRLHDQEQHDFLYDQDPDQSMIMDEKDENWENLSLLQRWQQRFLSYKYDMVIAFALALNVLWMAFELQVAGSRSGFSVSVYAQQMSEQDWQIWENTFVVVNLSFTGFFFLDVLVRICVLRLEFWKHWMNYIDLVVALLTGLEVFAFFSAAGLPVDPIMLRIVRMGKLARATRLVTLNSVLTSLELLIKYLAASTQMLFWSFCLLTFIQCVAGILASTLCLEFINNVDNDEMIRKEVYLYYGTFTRTFLTMFEVPF